MNQFKGTPIIAKRHDGKETPVAMRRAASPCRKIPCQYRIKELENENEMLKSLLEEKDRIIASKESVISDKTDLLKSCQDELQETKYELSVAKTRIRESQSQDSSCHSQPTRHPIQASGLNSEMVNFIETLSTTKQTHFRFVFG